MAASSLLMVATALAVVPANAAALPTPTAITASAATNNGTIGGAVPDVLVAVGDKFQLTVTLQPAGAAFKSDTTLTLTPSLESGSPKGSLSPTTIVMPADTNSQTFDVSYSAVDNGVIVTVAVKSSKGKPTDVTAGSTDPFDVLKLLTKFENDDPRLPNGLGVGNASCTQASTEPACGTLFLQHGAETNGALSLGACTPDLGCRSGSQVVQAIADLGTRYSQDDPALLVFRCDKKLCAGKGIKSYTLKLSFAATGPLNLVAAPCLDKGIARDAADNDFCVDYVQSHRDNSGDALLFLLFTHDMRAST